jgi:hypothetical protein
MYRNQSAFGKRLSRKMQNMNSRNERLRIVRERIKSNKVTLNPIENPRMMSSVSPQKNIRSYVKSKLIKKKLPNLRAFSPGVNRKIHAMSPISTMSSGKNLNFSSTIKSKHRPSKKNMSPTKVRSKLSNNVSFETAVKYSILHQTVKKYDVYSLISPQSRT